MRSIRRFMTLWLLLGIGVAVLGSAWTIYLIAREGLTREFTRALAGKAVALGSMLEMDEDGLEFEFAPETMPEFSRARSPEYFEIWVEGRSEARSRSLGASHLPRPPRSTGAPSTWNLALPDGRPGRALALPLVSRADDDAAAPGQEITGVSALVVVARSRAPLDEAIGNLVLGVIGAVLASSVVIILVVAWTVRRGLSPLVALGRRLDAMDAAHLSEPLPLEGQAREARPVVAKLNELFTRLDDAFRRERRVTASMAHELRTPIAEILSAAEVARRWPEDIALGEDAVHTAHEAARRMAGVVDSLLRLSRTEAGRNELLPESIDLAQLVRGCAAENESRRREADLTLEITEAGPTTVTCDRGLLTVIVRNLLDNAVAHTLAGGQIHTDLRGQGGQVVWTLSNAPVDLRVEDLERIREPLWTNERSRTRGHHSGLGLSLATAACEVLDLALEFDLVDSRFQARLVFPESGRAAESPRDPDRSALPVGSRPAGSSSGNPHDPATV